MTSFDGILRRLANRLFPQPTPSRGPAILMYHRIADESFDPWGLAVSPSNFAAQIQWLAANRSILSLSEFTRLHRRKALPDDAIAITFDDGYASVSEAAAPILDPFNAPATVFIPVDLIGREQGFWWDELEQIVLNHPGDSLDLNASIDLGKRSRADRRWQPGSDPQTPRQRAFLTLWEQLKTLSPTALNAAMDNLKRQSADVQAPQRLLTSEELRRRPSWLDVGSHALTHPSLPSLTRSEKAREISGSIERCEALSGIRPTAFAYPYGDIDRESLNLVRDAGFDCACTAQHSFVTRWTEAFSMPRLAVPNCDAPALASLLGTP